MSFQENVKTNLEKNLQENLEDYFIGDPNFGPTQEAELLRFSAAIRRINDKTIKLSGTQAELTVLADAAEQLEQQMDPLVKRRALAAYNKVFDFNDVGHTYAYSPITGRANPIAPPVFTKIENNKVICLVSFTDVYEGAPSCVYGGIVALTWDHVLAAATLIDNAPGPTAYLNITYRKPTPLKQTLRFESWIDRREGKKVWVKGLCYAIDASGVEHVVTEAEGLFINSLIRNINVTEEHLKQDIKR